MLAVLESDPGLVSCVSQVLFVRPDGSSRARPRHLSAAGQYGDPTSRPTRNPTDNARDNGDPTAPPVAQGVSHREFPGRLRLGADGRDPAARPPRGGARNPDGARGDAASGLHAHSNPPACALVAGTGCSAAADEPGFVVPPADSAPAAGAEGVAPDQHRDAFHYHAGVPPALRRVGAVPAPASAVAAGEPGDKNRALWPAGTPGRAMAPHYAEGVTRSDVAGASTGGGRRGELVFAHPRRRDGARRGDGRRGRLLADAARGRRGRGGA